MCGVAQGIVVIVMITVQQWHRPGQPIDVGSRRLIVRHVRQCWARHSETSRFQVLLLGIQNSLALAGVDLDLEALHHLVLCRLRRRDCSYQRRS